MHCCIYILFELIFLHVCSKSKLVSRSKSCLRNEKRRKVFHPIRYKPLDLGWSLILAHAKTQGRPSNFRLLEDLKEKRCTNSRVLTRHTTWRSIVLPLVSFIVVPKPADTFEGPNTKAQRLTATRPARYVNKLHICLPFPHLVYTCNCTNISL
jgi:hypothetical protein